MAVCYEICVVPLLLLLLNLYAAMAATEWAYGCRPDLNYTIGSQVDKNIETVLGNLVNGSFSAADHRRSSVGQSPDQINGIFQCRGDTSSSQCKNCAMDAQNALQNDCLSKRNLGGKVWMDLCFLRFENTTFIGVPDFEGNTSRNNSETVSNPQKFRNATHSLLQYLSFVARTSSGQYAAGNNTSVSPAVYGLVQCWNELSATECNDCLKRATEFLFQEEPTFTGSKSLLPNCMAVFDTTKFFFDSKDREHGHSSKIAVILGATGGAIILCLLCSFVALNRRKGNARKVPGSVRLDKNDSLLEGDKNVIFSIEALVAATNNFDENNKVGQGAFGQVYKGTLPDGTCIAVKKLLLQSAQGNLEFINEIKIVANVQHRNLVNLLGCCVAGFKRMLVYEYMPNGSLEKFIFGTEGRELLDWQTCYNIIIGVAKGLLYLHEDSKLKIIHRDIKPSNILLDDKFNPKIADFGLAKLFSEDQSHFQTRVAGTYGYMAPEYAMHGRLSIKADVYSFGVLMLEILSGKKNSESYTSVNSRSLLGWAWRLYQTGDVLDMLDEILLNHGNCVHEEAIRWVHIALLCVQADANLRPTMMEVVMMLSTNSVSLPIPTMPAFLDYSNSSNNTNNTARLNNENSVSTISPL